MCKKKVLVIIISVCKVGELYMNNVSINAKIEHFTTNLRKDIISNQYFHGVIAKRKKYWSSLLFVSTNHLREKL
jgi:hypothetical protein